MNDLTMVDEVNNPRVMVNMSKKEIEMKDRELDST